MWCDGIKCLSDDGSGIAVCLLGLMCISWSAASTKKGHLLTWLRLAQFQRRTVWCVLGPTSTVKRSPSVLCLHHEIALPPESFPGQPVLIWWNGKEDPVCMTQWMTCNWTHVIHLMGQRQIIGFCTTASGNAHVRHGFNRTGHPSPLATANTWSPSSTLSPSTFGWH